MKKPKEYYDSLLNKLNLFKGDTFSDAHIDSLMEEIDEIYEYALMYEGLCK